MNWREKKKQEEETNESVAKAMCRKVLKPGEEYKRPDWHKKVYGGR